MKKRSEPRLTVLISFEAFSKDSSVKVVSKKTICALTITAVPPCPSPPRPPPPPPDDPPLEEETLPKPGGGPVLAPPPPKPGGGFDMGWKGRVEELRGF